MNECKRLCENDQEKIPSIFDFDSKIIQFEIQNYESNQPLDRRPSMKRIWTDGKFDYDNDEWTDSDGTSIPDDFWENYTLYRKACSRV